LAAAMAFNLAAETNRMAALVFNRSSHITEANRARLGSGKGSGSGKGRCGHYNC